MEFPAWDPVLIEIPGLPIDIRWYGLMYVVGFAIAYQILVRLCRSGFLALAEEKVGDLIFYLVFGVLLGGRIGYALFYGDGLADPLQLVKIWEGGLSFHGGLLGVIVACALFARRNGLPGARLADALSLAVTPGIFAVRMANFINGELYGRVTSSETFGAMQFPTDETAERLMGIYGQGLSMRERELVIQVAVGKRDWESISGQMPQGFSVAGNPYVEGDGTRNGWVILREATDTSGDLLVPYRHPSQLYEGVSEGLLVGLLLLVVYRLTRSRPLGPGAYAGIFLLGYAVARVCCEFVRQPDAQFRDEAEGDTLGTVLLGMTMGQVLSLGMVIGGIGLLLYARARRSVASAEGA